MPFADYIQYRIQVSNGAESWEERQEIIISELEDMPFESFENNDEFLLAYIRADLDDPTFLSTISAYEGIEKIEKIHIKGENWNKIWEGSFQPITILNSVIVRAPFHHVDKNFTHEIIIEPKMSFGTGHHSTTRLMMECMLDLHFENRSVLDMGCGTGILAILAAKLGAKSVLAVDNDLQCIENTLENISLNNCQQVQVYLNEEISPNFKTDIILANIQKNVLIEQMPLYKSWLTQEGQLLVSGIYQEAIMDVMKSAEKEGMNCVSQHMLNDWCLIHFKN